MPVITRFLVLKVQCRYLYVQVKYSFFFLAGFSASWSRLEYDIFNLAWENRSRIEEKESGWKKRCPSFYPQNESVCKSTDCWVTKKEARVLIHEKPLYFWKLSRFFFNKFWFDYKQIFESDIFRRTFVAL